MAWIISQELNPPTFQVEGRWPDLHVQDLEGKPVPMHPGQQLAMESTRRIVAMIAGSQGGKTGLGPQMLWKWIKRWGGGDWLAVTSTYDLFKLKMLPALLHLFEETLRIGRYWSGDRILELADPATGLFHAARAADPMWCRIILRSADSTGGIEAGTGKGAWLDEAGQSKFDIDAWRAILRRLALSQGPILLTSTLYEHGWVDSEIIDKAQKGGETHVIDTGRGEIEVTDNPDAKICLIQFDSLVNPVFPMEEYERARAEMPDDEFEAFYRGRRTSSRMMIYDCFDSQLNVCPRFEIPDSWPRYLGIDPGGVNLAALAIAEDPTSGGENLPPLLYVYKEYMGGGLTAAEHADRLRSFAPGYRGIFGGAASEDQWRREFAAGGIMGGNRIAGLPVRKPPVSDLDVQLERVYAQFKMRRLVVFDDLHGLLKQIATYRRKRDRHGNLTTEIENKSQYHLLDALRYPVSSLRTPTGERKAKAMMLDVG